MIDINYANKNIILYKKDYYGCKVIIDRIATNHILTENDLYKKRLQLNEMTKQYKKELQRIMRQEECTLNLFVDAYKLSAEDVIKNLQYISSRLSAIGYILIGKGKEIGLE